MGPNEPLLESESPILASAATEKISSELEEILSDTSLSCIQRFKRASVIELRNLFRLAAPAIIVYLLNNVTSMSTQIFCGHLGNLELAAASLGNSGIQLLAYGVMVILFFFTFIYSFITNSKIFISYTFAPNLSDIV